MSEPSGARNWPLIGVGVAVVALVAVVVLLLTGVISVGGSGDGSDAGGNGRSPAGKGSGDQNSAQKPFPITDLNKLLSSDEELAGLISAGAGYTITPMDYLFGGAPTDGDCGALTVNGMKATYNGSGWAGTRRKALAYPTNDSTSSRAWQSVIGYHDASSAADFLAQVQAKLADCAGKSYDDGVTGQTGYSSTWNFGQPSESDGIVTFKITQEGGGGWGCQASIAARNNIVVHASVCGRDISDSASVAVAKPVLDRIPNDA